MQTHKQACMHINANTYMHTHSSGTHTQTQSHLCYSHTALHLCACMCRHPGTNLSVTILHAGTRTHTLSLSVRLSVCLSLSHIAADISCYQWMCTIVSFESFVLKQPVFCSIAVLKLVTKTWWPAFVLFVESIVMFWMIEKIVGWLAAQNPWWNVFELFCSSTSLLFSLVELYFIWIWLVGWKLNAPFTGQLNNNVSHSPKNQTVKQDEAA